MIRASAALLGLFAGAAAAAAGEVERSFSERFDVAPGARLALRHGDGNVEITAWDEAAIAVDVTYRVKFLRIGVGSDPDLEVDFEQRGEVVRVTGRERGTSGIGFSIAQRQHLYRVRAPRWVELELDGEDGEVAIEGWEAAINLRLDNGDARLDDVRGGLRASLEDGNLTVRGLAGELTVRLADGDVRISDCQSERARIETADGDVRISDCQSERARIETADGDVELDGCAGSVDVSTADGDLDLAGLVAGTVALTTADGDVAVEVVAAEGDLDLHVQTEAGDVDVTLAPGVGAAFDLTSEDGAVEVGTGAEDLSFGRRRATGRFGDGSGKVRVSTGEGQVSLRQRE